MKLQEIDKINISPIDEEMIKVFETSIQKELINANKIIEKINKDAVRISKQVKLVNESFNSMLEDNNARLNELLNVFNIRYKITNDGMDPRNQKTEVKICLRAEDESNNKDITASPLNEFISFGEFHTIAFIFFLLNLDSKIDESKKLIILIDYPSSSHDAFRKYTTAGEIAKLIQRLDISKHRLMISTHESSFCRSMFFAMEKSSDLMDFFSFRNLNGSCVLKAINKDDFKNYIQYLVKMINSSEYSEITKLILIRLLLDFDRSFIGSGQYKDLYNYLCDILHCRPGKTLSDIGKREYDELGSKYKLIYRIRPDNSEYKTMVGALLSKATMTDTEGNNIMSDSDRFILARVIADNYLINTLKIKNGINNTLAIKNDRLRSWIEKHKPLLNSVMHDDDRTTQPCLDFKDIELIGMKPIDTLYSLLV